MLKIKVCFLLISVLLLLCSAYADKKSNNKYYEQVKNEGYDPDFRTLQRPFRMAKLNLVWSKAQNVRYKFYIYLRMYVCRCQTVWMHIYLIHTMEHSPTMCMSWISGIHIVSSGSPVNEKSFIQMELLTLAIHVTLEDLFLLIYFVKPGRYG